MPGGFLEHVSRNPGSKDWTVQLAVPPQGAKGRYLTLSHRWGSKHHLKLTRCNFKSLQEGITVQSLPQTYRDAAIVAAQLGYRYLWIDALCIVQDDPEDWRRESVKMCTVYRNSYCTIFAHTSNQDNDGFLAASRGYSPRWYFPPSSINSRGWVFQERILSRRILHFVHGGVFFEDASGTYTTRLFDGIYDAPRDVPLRLAKHPLLEDRKANLDDAIEKPTKWYELVEKYTQCDLTYHTDRLPAVEGLAHYYKHLSDEAAVYAHGMWLSSLHQGLLWIETGHLPDKTSSNSHGCMAPPPPSWSWARWTRIRYPFHLANCLPIAFTVQSLDPESSVLAVRATLVTWHNVVARRVASDEQRYASVHSFAGAPLRNVYRFTERPTLWQAVWVALDGERGDEVRHDEVSTVLVAVNTKVTLFCTEDDDYEQPREYKEHIYYFLMLKRT
ncbi:Vegetative incompatibility protein HET-E-1 [Madurella mycetomatis]|uniref:Vegetative incompatibility protein HET-E-1 n=1 Tax=Madurella mycetomatis TaxID=100816 RepID=A0A175VY33_9PEZI|nr:Vegetative incompatibility protein HET-E-1 [Madurella mycetomatis]